MGAIYGEEFERNFNTMTSPANIKATAEKFVEFEKAHGTSYSFGMFAKASGSLCSGALRKKAIITARSTAAPTLPRWMR
jgi:hypothetical protein